MLQDISRRYAALSHGIMNGCGNVTYYALSATLIGDFLKAGGCDLGTDKNMIPSDWVGQLNHTQGVLVKGELIKK